jgi:hypothetical protein
MPEFSDTIIRLFNGLKKREATGEVCSQSYDCQVLNSHIIGWLAYWF